MASIKDVAKLAGVSVAAVSKYLKTPQNMREDTKEKISHAIEQLKYRPNPLAQSLRTGKTNIIAIALPEVDNPYFSQIFKLLQSLCDQRGLLAILLNNSTGNRPRSIEGIIKSGLVDGVIFYDDGQSDISIQELEANLPIVIMTAQPNTNNPATVGINLQTGIQKLCAHLEETGAQYLCYIGADNNISAHQKIQAVSDYCKESSLCMNPLVYTTNNSSYNDGLAAVKRLLATESTLPDVIIAESDMIALGVLKGLTEEDIKVPQDIRISGYDDTDISQMSNPSLTSVHIPMNEICTCALNMLCSLMMEQSVAPVFFQTDLQIRESTMPPI